MTAVLSPALSALGTRRALRFVDAAGWALVVGIVMAGCSVDQRTLYVATGMFDGASPDRDGIANERFEDARGVSSDDGAVRKVMLYPNGEGFLDGTNEAGVVGHWYAYLDSRDDNFQPPGNCQLLGRFRDDQCSSMTQPATYPPFKPSDSIHGQMCTTGTVAQVIDSPIDGLLDYVHIWGGGIGMEFNNAGTNARAIQPYDAPAHHVAGVSFVINSPPSPGSLRIQFPTSDNPATGGVWTSPVKPGFNTVLWKDVVNTTYLANPPPFDPALVLTIQFQVVANPGGPVAFDFCVSDLAMILD